MYGAEARWERERELGYVDVLPNDHGTCIHECQTLLQAWFTGPWQEGVEMAEATGDFLLAHGSLWMEIYVCMLRIRAMPEELVWDHAVYWARMIHCLYVLHANSTCRVEALLEQVLHGYNIDFNALEWKIRDIVAGYHHLHGVIQTEDRHGYSPCNSATFSDTDE
eukprot:GHVU01001548.1.p1 GENE.GHVU01001548.1~~GHVU01001548.1.p1  ORF type:complete len:165 (+),score=11.65 GHVU01001548.1:1854-2348(+)